VVVDADQFVEEGRGESRGGEARADRQGRKEPGRAQHAFQTRERKLQEHGLAARPRRQHGRAVIEHEQIALSLQAGPLVLLRGQHARELEDHDERVALANAERRLDDRIGIAPEVLRLENRALVHPRKLQH